MTTETESSAQGGQSRTQALEHDVNVIETSAHRLANDVNGIVQAWSQANAEVFKGTVSVLGHLLVGLNDSLSRTDLRPSGDRPSDGTAAMVDQANDVVGGVSKNVSGALTEMADVLQRSSQRFHETFEESTKPAAKSGGGRKSTGGKSEPA